jgi:hypothetical protein
VRTFTATSGSVTFAPAVDGDGNHRSTTDVTVDRDETVTRRTSGTVNRLQRGNRYDHQRRHDVTFERIPRC